MSKTIRNIGIFAHADAGKTTVTENFLFASGKTKSLGKVDDGTTQTDYLNVEKARGISVRSSYTSFIWKDTLINLIDTPGHVDFTAEVERSLKVIDAAILVISAAEGVQAHTETIWNGLKKRNIPVIFFINKIDRAGADYQLATEEIEKELTVSLAVIHKVINEGNNDASIHSIWNTETMNNKTIENLSECNDEMLELYLNEKQIDFKLADNYLKFAIKNANIYPVLAGSAKNSVGIYELLDAVIHYFPKSSGKQDKDLSAVVFGISHDKTMGKTVHVKVFNGKINNREVIYNHTQKTEEKITQIRKVFAGSFSDTGIVSAGDIAGLCGLKDTQTGDILGQPSEHIPEDITLKTPLLTVQVKPLQEKDYADLAYALQELSKEDPSLNFDWLKDEKELHVKIMGWIQMQIIESILKDRFNIKAKFENPTIIYKETPAKTGEGFVKYWMPKPCWAIMKFKIEPGERGSGIDYLSAISVDDVHQKYQNEVERTIPKALIQGIKGWEVTDIKITLIEGEDHQVHSNPGDFVVAAPMGIMEGLKNIGTTLLEPIISFKISAPEELLGKITSDITQMRGTFESPDIENGKFILTGTMPLSTSLDYPVKLSSRSGGKAKISTKFHSYQTCSDEEGQIREYKGISPLNTAKYILKARKALQ
ncbi:MAG: TetM/TetW/TetO/TetS family tetracycline resistance ribosomal protection protein [Bacteroidales bacterium]|nr:TetM/TetW/TetO/TetS family tetracycline resistance ribosomal protection protein [Bacteroidales bacterium]